MHFVLIKKGDVINKQKARIKKVSEKENWKEGGTSCSNWRRKWCWRERKLRLS